MERHYLVGGTVQGSAVGMFGLVTTYAFPDAFGELGGRRGDPGVDRDHLAQLWLALDGDHPVGRGGAAHLRRHDAERRSRSLSGAYIIPLVVIITRLATSVTVLATAVTEEKKANELALKILIGR